MTRQRVRLTIGRVGDTSSHGHNSLRLGPAALTHPGNQAALPILWAHDPGAYLGHTLAFGVLSGVGAWEAILDLQQLAALTSRDPSTLGVSPTVDLHTAARIDSLGVWAITDATRVHHLALTDRPAFANSRLTILGPAPAAAAARPAAAPRRTPPAPAPRRREALPLLTRGQFFTHPGSPPRRDILATPGQARTAPRITRRGTTTTWTWDD